MSGVVKVDHLRVAVKAIIAHDNGDILLVRRADHPGADNPLKYTFPGGALKPGESLIEGLRREVREELSLDIEVRGLVAFNEWTAAKRGAYYIGLFFGCDLADPGAAITLNRENREYKWASSADVRRLDLVDSARRAAAQYKSNGGKVLPYPAP